MLKPLNDLKSVLSSYDNGANLNFPNKSGETPLAQAIISQQMQIVQWLLNQSAKTDITDNAGNSVLHHAATGSRMELLISIGNKMSNIDRVNNNKQTPLILAIINNHQQIAQWLINKSANPDHQDIFGKSARTYAIEQKLPLVFEPLEKSIKEEQMKRQVQQRKYQINALVAQKTDKNNRYYNWPTLLIAVAQKQQYLSNYLLESGADPWRLNPLNETALYLAIISKQTALLDKMLLAAPLNSHRGEKALNALFSAAIEYNHSQLVDKLIPYLNKDNSQSDNNELLISAVRSNSNKVVELLLKNKSNKATGDLLHRAVNAGYQEIIGTLLLNKAPVDQGKIIIN